MIEPFPYNEKFGFKLIKIQLYTAKMSVVRVGSRTPATSKMIFLVIVKEWKLSIIVTNSSVLDVTMVLDTV